MIIYGKNVIKEALYAKRNIYHLYVDEKIKEDAFLAFVKDRYPHIEFVSKQELNQMTQNALHQGFVAEVKPYEYMTLEEVLKEDQIQRFLILDGLEDPHNLGAILRTAEAVGLDGIIMSNKNQVKLNATVAKVSSGAIEHVKVIEVGNINQTIEKLKKKNVYVIGTDGSATHSYQEIPKHFSTAIVLGHEGQGIRPLVKQNCDMLVKIPMYGKVNSLNVSVAAALMMYVMI